MKHIILFKRHFLNGCKIGLVIIGSLLAGCATMQSSVEELDNLKENEGIIIGSVLITVEESKTEESSWAWLKGQKAGTAKYALSMNKIGTSFNPFSTTYQITVTPEKEEVFIKKMPAGKYIISKIHKQGFTNLYANIKINIEVKPGETTYVGKLIVKFPNRLRAGSKYKIKVEDEQEKTVDALKNEYRNIISSVSKTLMVAK